MKVLEIRKPSEKDLDLLDNETMIFVPESDYGLAEIRKKDGKFELYSIPMYGGEPQLEMVDSNASIILNELNGWC